MYDFIKTIMEFRETNPVKIGGITMIINGNVATEVEEDVEIPATEELVDGSTTEVGSEVLKLDNEQDEQNTEQVQEDKPKTYTEEEFNQRLEEKINEILPRRLERRADKIEKEYKRKYSENILKIQECK